MFIFASEIKAILEHPLARRVVDLTRLDQVLALTGLVSPQTMFKGIKSLKRGHYITVKDSDVKFVEYWDLDYPKKGDIAYSKPESYYVDNLKELFSQSVKYRLQADVSVGYYLSGGLDSSLIAGMIHQLSPDSECHSFSIGFIDKSMDEAKYQKMVAHYFDSIHHEIIFDWTEIPERLESMVYHCECPVKETYNTCSMALSEATKKTGVTVILTGEGADELFAGYVGYRFDQFWMHEDERYDYVTLFEEDLREKVRGDRNLFYESDLYSLQEVKAALYSQKLVDMFDEFDCLNYELINKERLKGRPPIHQRSYLDFKLRMSDHLISDHGDRMALANSVEARYPHLKPLALTKCECEERTGSR